MPPTMEPFFIKESLRDCGAASLAISKLLGTSFCSISSATAGSQGGFQTRGLPYLDSPAPTCPLLCFLEFPFFHRFSRFFFLSFPLSLPIGSTYYKEISGSIPETIRNFSQNKNWETPLTCALSLDLIFLCTS